MSGTVEAIRNKRVLLRDNWGQGDIDHSSWVISLSDLMSLLLIFFLVWTTLKVNAHAPKREEVPPTKISQRIRGLMMEFSPVRLDSGNIMVVLQDEILFPSGQATIGDDGKRILHRIALLLKREKNFRLRIIGHCDNMPVSQGGRWKSNYQLSLQRASQVANELITDGLDPRQIMVQGLGDLYPASPNTYKRRRFNRRVELVIEPMKG